MATAAVIGRLVVNIEARYEKLMTGIKKAGDAIGHFTARVTRWIGTHFNKIMLGMTATASAAFYGVASAVTASVDSIDKLNDAAGKLGTTTDMLAKLRHAGKMSGVEFEAMDSALEKMLKNLSSARLGSGPAVDALRELGLTADKLMKNPIDVQLQKIADGIQSLTSHEDKLRVTLAIFGKGGGGLVNTFEDGAAGIRAMANEAERLGIAIDSNDAKQVAAMADAWDRLKAAAGGLISQFTIDITPVAVDAINGLTAIMQGLRSGKGASTSKAGVILDDVKWFIKGQFDPFRRFFEGAGERFGRFFTGPGQPVAPMAARWRLGVTPLNLGVDTETNRGNVSASPAVTAIAGGIRTATQFFVNAAQQADKALYANIEPARVFAEDALRKIDKEMERTGQLESFGKQLTEQFMDPWERLDKQRKDIAEAFGRKLITEAVAFEANAQADRDFEANRREWELRNGQDPGTRRELSLLESGTNEAFAALRRNMQGGTSDKILDVNKKQLEANKQAVDHLKALADQFKLLQAVGIN